MAETIDYKVRIDTSSLADQLQQVRNQIDQAMATYTFRTASPDPIPQAYAFPEQQYVSQLGGAAPGPAMGVGAGQAVDTGRRMLWQDMNGLYQSTRLGFHKFSQDAMNLALMSQLGAPRGIAAYGELNMPNFSDQGFWRQGMSTLGFGWNPHMSVGFGDYTRYASNAFSDNGLSGAFKRGADFMSSTAGNLGLASTVLGFAGASTAAAWTGAASAILAAPAAAYELGRPDYEAYLGMRGVARDTSWRFLSGRFSLNEASNIASQAVHLGRGQGLVGYGMGLTDVQETMRSYTEAGGFDFVRNSRDFAEALKTIVESIGQGSQALRMSRDEYSRWQTQMGRMGLAGNTQEALSLSTMVAARALGAGYTAQELSQFGMQTAEMVRGTGISLGSAFVGGVSLLSDLRAAARAGAISTETIQQAGGFENAAATIARTGYQFGQSSAGFSLMAAESFYGRNWMAAGADPATVMMGAMGRITSPQEYLRMRGSMPARLSQKNPEELFMDMASWDIQSLALKTGGKVDRESFLGYETSTMGRDQTTAMLMWDMANNTTNRTQAIAAGTAERTIAAQPGFVSRVADRIGNAFMESALVQGPSQALQGYQGAFDRLGRTISNIRTGIFEGYTTYQRGGPADPTAMTNLQYAKVLTNEAMQPRLQELAHKYGVDFGPRVMSAERIEGLLGGLTQEQGLALRKQVGAENANNEVLAAAIAKNPAAIETLIDNAGVAYAPYKNAPKAADIEAKLLSKMNNEAITEAKRNAPNTLQATNSVMAMAGVQAAGIGSATGNTGLEIFGGVLSAFAPTASSAVRTRLTSTEFDKEYAAAKSQTERAELIKRYTTTETTGGDKDKTEAQGGAAADERTAQRLDQLWRAFNTGTAKVAVVSMPRTR